MARKAAPAASLSAHDDNNIGAVADDAARHGELVTARERTLAEIDDRFGIDVPYDYDRYVGIVRDAVDGISRRAFVIGRALIQIKEREPHGRFLPTLQEIGISERFAQQCMATVVKFGGSGAKELVGARLSQSKLLDLLVEPDDSIEALGDGGTLAGLTLDEIDRMSTRELRAALREARKDSADELAARDEIIARKDEKLRALELRTRKAAKAPLREQGDELLGICLQRLAVFTAEADSLKSVVDEIKALFYGANEDVPADIAQQVDYVADMVAFHANALRGSCEA